MSAPTHPHTKRSLPERDALEARFALRVVAALDDRGVPHDIEQRLRIARELAGARARATRSTAARSAGAVAFETGELALRGGPAGDGASWKTHLAVVGLVLALVMGLWAIDSGNTRAQIDAAADIDAALLADDLPPKAYIDAGFREFVRSPQD